MALGSFWQPVFSGNVTLEGERGMIDDVEREAREHFKRGDYDAATVCIVRGYGPEILGFLIAQTGDEVRGDDAFSLFCEDLVRGLPTFEWRASARTWCYKIARRAAARLRRTEGRVGRREVLAGSEVFSNVVAQVRSQTAAHQRTNEKDRVRALREQLSDEERLLLILRVDRDLSWRDLAQVLADEQHEVVPEATLRKRFQRAKEHLFELAKAQGVIGDEPTQ